MDLYTSTRDSFKLFHDELPFTQCLPRVVSYFDDIMGATFGDLNGQRLAMHEFNEQHTPHRSISPVYGLRHHLGWPHRNAQWTHMLYWTHILDHPRYPDYDGLAGEAQAPLR
jgi:hypothetical protein